MNISLSYIQNFLRFEFFKYFIQYKVYKILLNVQSTMLSNNWFKQQKP